MATGIVGLTGNALAEACGNSDECAKTLAPGMPTSPSPGEPAKVYILLPTVLPKQTDKVCADTPVICVYQTPIRKSDEG